MANPIPGPVTGVNLTAVEPLMLPWTADPWGRLRPPLSPEALLLSAEMAAGCRSLNITPWLRAGWRDVTVQVDGDLIPLEREWQSLAARWQRRHIRGRMQGVNPLQQIVGAWRERESASTGKAVVMLRPAPGRKYVVAICFMGTGGRFYDWFSNFRIATPEGIHQGFSQLTDQFEDNETAIEFPETAAQLGLERLTLLHILQEAKSADSRFRIWVCGHSQGGAVMQVWVRRKLLEDGVHPGNIVGYGFASPSVMTGAAEPHPEAFPLYHIHNSDDLIPRCGAAVHLGLCLTYPADEKLRRACYGWPRDAASVQARLAVRPVVRQMTDTPGCILQATAFCTVLRDCTPAEIAAALGVSDSPAVRLLNMMDVKQTLTTIIRRMALAHLSVTGRPLPETAVQESAALMRRIAAEVGLKAFAGAMGQLLRQPHRMSARSAAEYGPAYIWIAMHGMDKLIPSIWKAGQTPQRLTLPKKDP